MLDGGLDGIESATLKPGTGYSQSSLSSAESPRSGGSSGGPAPLRGETVTLTITKADASSPVGLALGEARDGRSIVVQGDQKSQNHLLGQGMDAAKAAGVNSIAIAADGS